MKFPSTAILLLGSVFFSGGVPAQESQELAAKAALINIANRYGADQVQWIVELRGFYGQPQPKEWEVVVYHAESPHLVHEYWAGRNGEVSDEGPSKDFYPKRSPTGFIKLSDLKLDSKAAFTVAEGEARKAKMGFNALNFYLRAREYSREPIWTLELLDINEDLVGKIYISGDTGEVLRTVWFYRGEKGRPDGKPILIDSATPNSGNDPGPLSNSTTGSEPPLSGPPSPPPGTPGAEPDPSDPSGSQPPVPPADVPDGTRIPKPPVPPSGGGAIDTRIPPPPVPPASN